LSLTAAIRGGHEDARQLRRAQMQARRHWRRRDTLAAELAATRATTSAGVRGKLLLALGAFDLDGTGISLVRSAASDLRTTKMNSGGDAR
jgi:hypothetical protein